jgi:hypothetical protein
MDEMLGTGSAFNPSPPIPGTPEESAATGLYRTVGERTGLSRNYVPAHILEELGLTSLDTFLLGELGDILSTILNMVVNANIPAAPAAPADPADPAALAAPAAPAAPADPAAVSLMFITLTMTADKGSLRAPGGNGDVVLGHSFVPGANTSGDWTATAIRTLEHTCRYCMAVVEAHTKAPRDATVVDPATNEKQLELTTGLHVHALVGVVGGEQGLLAAMSEVVQAVQSDLPRLPPWNTDNAKVAVEMNSHVYVPMTQRGVVGSFMSAPGAASENIAQQESDTSGGAGGAGGVAAGGVPAEGGAAEGGGATGGSAVGSGQDGETKDGGVLTIIPARMKCHYQVLPKDEAVVFHILILIILYMLKVPGKCKNGGKCWACVCVCVCVCV